MSDPEFPPQPRTCGSFDCNRPALPFATRCPWCLERDREAERAARAEERACEQRCDCDCDDRCAPCEAAHVTMEAAGDGWAKE